MTGSPRLSRWWAWNVVNDIPLFEILEIRDKTCPIENPEHVPDFERDSWLRHQNHPPDGTTPLRRRYVTRLP
jgi:hypothetical protein